MKIAFDHQIFSIQKYGGVSRYCVKLAEYIPQVAANETDIKIIAPFYKNEYLANAVGEFGVIGMKVPDLSKKTGPILGYVNSFVSPFLVGNYDPDVIHETYYTKNIIGHRKTKRILTVHDMIHELFPEYFSKYDSTRESKKIAVSRADHIICVSENTKNDLIRILGVDESRVSVVHLGFELAAPNLSVRSVRSKPFFLYVGNRGGYKNFKFLVRAYASSKQLLKNLDFVCFGGGSFNAEELNLFEDQKIPLGRMQQVTGNDALLSQYYKDALFFVYPSLYEGFGIPPLEAMNHGCPIACSNTSSIPEVVGEAAIMFDPHSIESIQDSLEKLFLDSSTREFLISQGFERIKNYSWQKCAGETLEIYNKVLS